LERAIRLAPRNADYRYSLAQFYLQCGMTRGAKSEFRAMLKIDPSDARPYYQLARFKEEDYFLYRDMVSPHENTTLYYYPFAEKDFAETERLLRTAIVLDPKMSEAYFRLAALYYEIPRYEEMADWLERGIAHQPSTDLFLFLGLARQQLGKTDEAMVAYEQALRLMSPADRALFYSLQPILAPDALAVYEKRLDSFKAKMSRSAFDSLFDKENQNFWKARDQLFLTDANERLLEHFDGGVCQSALQFSGEKYCRLEN
jgi:tetratricopeptide (TPR) repeat protein